MPMRQSHSHPIFGPLGNRSLQKWLFLSLAAMTTMLGSSHAYAADDGIHMKPGTWIFDVRIQMPLQTEPSEQRLQTCVTEEPITAEDLMPWAESQGCRIRSVKAKENALTWKLKCKISGQRSRGRGSFEVDGDKGEGKTTINFEMGGRRLSIITEWDAQHVGPCIDRPASTSSDARGEDEAS